MSRNKSVAPWENEGMMSHLYKRSRQKQSPAAQRQEVARSIIQRRFMEMCLNRFEWTGLPYTLNQTYLESLLMRDGQAIVGIDPRSRALVGLQASTVGNPNYQNEYIAYRGTGPSYPTTTFSTMVNHRQVNGEVVTDYPNGVVVFNNATRTGDFPAILYYGDRITELDTTIDINSMNTRRNKIVYANTDTELAMANILGEQAAGEPIIRSRNPELAGQITTLDLSVHPDMVDKLHIFRGRLWNEAMMEFGVDNTNQDKKERLVTAELGGNDDQIARIRSSMLQQRREAAKRITLLMRANGFPETTNITVDYNVQDDPANDPMMEVPGVGDNDSTV